ncbi:MAG: hypothetical protein FWF44_09455, partial [Defluviitaleaceae bacterium]|nr:hypothetical protein [Defluviitaleaceae bacterium]
MKRLPWDKKYLTILLHAVAAFALMYAAKLVLDGLAMFISGFPRFFQGAFHILGRALAVLSPLIVGFIIAYLLDPVVDFFQKLFHRLTKRPPKGARRVAGTAAAYALILLIFGGVILWLILKFNMRGDFLASLTGLVNSLRL